MPVTYTKLDIVDILEELKRRKYAFHGNRNAAIHLTVADPKNRFKMTNAPRRVLLRPIGFETYEQIVTQCASVNEACDQIEAISLGHDLNPTMAKPGAISAEASERIIQNRVQNELAHATQPLADQLSQQQELLEKQNEVIAALKRQLESGGSKPGRKKPGPKPGTKRKSRVVEEAAADLANDGDLPELTEAQQKMMANVRMGE